MKAFKFVVGNVEHDRSIRQLINLLGWFESDEGFYFKLHEGENNYMGHSFDQHGTEVLRKVHDLLTAFPENDFLIDLRSWRYPIDACCEFHGIIR